jgi:glycosyltransferase involved in cell wall biosynthesis
VVKGDRRHEARAQFGLPQEGKVVVYLGALTPEKQVDLAVAAVTELPGVHLLIAGDGPERGALETLAEERARGRVHFVGVADDSARVLAAGDLVVLPSRTEGLPVVLIEAGLSGLPVVATDVGFVHDIVVDRETGFLVSPGDLSALIDGIANALEDSGRVGQAARARCLVHFELDPVARAWDELITELSRD